MLKWTYIPGTEIVTMIPPARYTPFQDHPTYISAVFLQYIPLYIQNQAIPGPVLLNVSGSPPSLHENIQLVDWDLSLY